MGKADKDSLDLEPLSLLEQLLPLYTEILSKLASAGATEVQIDEPVLVLDLPANAQAASRRLHFFGEQSNLPKITLATTVPLS